MLRLATAHIAPRRHDFRLPVLRATAAFLLAMLMLPWPVRVQAQGPPMASTRITTENGVMQATTTTGAAAPQFHPSRLLVKFRNGARAFLPGSPNAHGFSHDSDVFVVDTPPGLSVAAAVAQYRANPNVVYAEPDHLVSIVATPNDPRWANQWDMTKIMADLAWDTQTAAPDVYVAVIDTGINDAHPDLAANVVPGWNCINAAANIPVGCKANQVDDHGHGTHVAGTIGAVGNNGVGIAGINWVAKMMAFKFLNSGGSGYVSDAMYAFNKIAQLKNSGTNFRVTNNSWGGGGYDQALKDAMLAVEALGIVNVCAAGNSGADADTSPMLPAGYDNRGIVSVLATDLNDVGASFTNYGISAVDIAAPGVNTLSTVPTSVCSLCDVTGYKLLSGTSMASPHVAGAVAAMMQRHMALNGGANNLSAAMARDVLLDKDSYDVLSDARGKSTSTGGRLNMRKLFDNPKLQTPPAQLNNFPTLTLGANIFAAGNQPVTISASGSDPDAADIPGLRFSWGKAGSTTWLFGSMLYSLFPIPPTNPYTFTTPLVGRTAVEKYRAGVTDNRGGGASGTQFVTVSPVGTQGPPDGTFSICQTGIANCAGSGAEITVPRTISCPTTAEPTRLCADVSVNYAPLDPDNKGTPLWDSWYSSNGGAGGSCCYSGPSMVRRFTAAGVFRISVNSVDKYLETSPTTTAGRKTAIVRVDGATGTPPLAQLTADKISGPAPLTVNFSMAGTQAFDGKSIQWYFMGCGEGFLSGKATPTHTCVFNTPGTYWVEDLVADTGGLDDVVNMYIVVTPPNGGGGDTTPPSVAMTAPSAGNVKGSITVAANASDTGGSNMKEVKFYRDAGVLINTIAGAGPYSFSWDTSTAGGDGPHTLYAVATDNANNSTTSGSVNITVDNTVPSVSITSPTGGSTVSGAIAVNASAADTPGSGVASVTFWLDGVGATNLGTDGTPPYSINWNTVGADGGHTLTAVATDNVGFTTTSSPVNITVNNSATPPAVNLTYSPAVAKKASVTITANVTPGTGTVTKVDFYINGILVSTDISAPYTHLWKVPAAAGKTYVIRAVATDTLGKTGEDTDTFSP